MLPSQVQCVNCHSDLELDNIERQNQAYCCPACENGYLDSAKYAVLESTITCFKCNKTIELSNRERANRTFKCPSCETYWSTQKIASDSESYEEQRKSKQSNATAKIGIGILFLLIGIVFTGESCAAASERGGHYYIALGPIIFGILLIRRGMNASSMTSHVQEISDSE